MPSTSTALSTAKIFCNYKLNYKKPSLHQGISRSSFTIPTYRFLSYSSSPLPSLFRYYLDNRYLSLQKITFKAKFKTLPSFKVEDLKWRICPFCDFLPSILYLHRALISKNTFTLLSYLYPSLLIFSAIYKTCFIQTLFSFLSPNAVPPVFSFV